MKFETDIQKDKIGMGWKSIIIYEGQAANSSYELMVAQHVINLKCIARKC